MMLVRDAVVVVRLEVCAREAHPSIPLHAANFAHRSMHRVQRLWPFRERPAPCSGPIAVKVLCHRRALGGAGREPRDQGG
jgi:hypothetical protein